jgi:peptidyl-prolyl cis-trans isomerase SurA
MRKTLSLFATIFGLSTLIGQTSEQEVLLKINNKEVTKDEFLRIYNKNRGIETDNSLSVDDYLQLFINYKLKVEEAENLGYDTVPAFVKEMGGYKKQLSKPYLENDDMLESNCQMEYQRMHEEINAAHILVMHNFTASPKDTIEAYNKALSIRQRILAGEPFASVAAAMSDDKSAVENGGNLGWFSALRMVDPFENACYNLKVGEISDIVKTQFGYHIIRVNGRRPNKGDINVSHIFTSIPKNSTDAEKQTAKQKIEKAYSELIAGAAWDSVTAKYSEHPGTASKGGKLGWVNMNSIPSEFIDACYDMNPGEYSKPFLTNFGYHIVKLNETKPVAPYEELKSEISKKVKLSPAFVATTKETLTSRIKKEYGFKSFEENIVPFYTLCDSTVLRGKWDYNKAKDLTKPVLTIGDKTCTQFDFAKFIAEKKLYNVGISVPINIYNRFNDYIEKEVIAYEEERLPLKYPELRYLLEEYHDGILLFNLTEDVVWKKAIDDTAGLKSFYDQLPEKYSWGQRIVLTKYSYSDSTKLDALLKLAKKNSKGTVKAEEFSAKLCPTDSLPCVSITELKYEKGDNSLADSITWKPGSYLPTKDGNKFVLFYVKQILQPQTKFLTDAKGLYTADYQNYLEKNWINLLRNKYNIQINNEVLEGIKKEQK